MHRNITDNETETKLDTYKQVINECIDDTSTAVVGYCVDKNLNFFLMFNNINEIGVDEDGGETKDIEEENIIHRDNTGNEL